MDLTGPELRKARAMLAEKIRAEGEIMPGNILLVDRFLNQQMDIPLYRQIGKAFAEVFGDTGVTKVLTIEASGIALAFATAQELGVPALFAKKKIPMNIGENYYESRVYSYTKDDYFPITLSDYLLGKADKLLIVDDFLARGEAQKGLIRLCREAGADVIGVGIAIEKRFQGGWKFLRDAGVPLLSLHVIESFETMDVARREQVAKQNQRTLGSREAGANAFPNEKAGRPAGNPAFLCLNFISAV